jgi:sarcosine oxidase subunit gamma
MADPCQWQSPLAHLGLAAWSIREGGPGDAGVRLSERPARTQVNVRGNGDSAAFSGAVTAALGVELPVKPNTTAAGDGIAVLWLGPDEWLVVAAPDAGMAAGLEMALAGDHGAVTDVSESRAVIGLAGANARQVLMKGCSLDLHPRAFRAGRCTQTLLARAGVILHQTGNEPAYDIYVARSFADYLWTWLEDAAEEYGVRVTSAET